MAPSGTEQRGEAGERWFGRLLVGLCLAILCVLGVVAVYLVRHPGLPRDIYFDLQRRASLVYVGFWAAITLVALIFALMRRTRFIALYVLLLIAAEGGAHAYFYARNGRIYHPTAPILQTRFEPHPLLVGIPHPGVYGPVSHDSSHHRTTWNQGKVADPIRVLTFGGSTTYDIGVPDDATWSSDLSRLLGKDFEVENLGVPGYSSLENLIQSLFVFRDAKVACAIYYVGGNDLRASHVEGLRADYTDFLLPAQVGNLGVGHRPGFLENNMLLLRLAGSIFADRRAGGYSGVSSGEKDPRLSAIFSENMRLIAEIARHFGVKPIFVPQVVNEARLRGDRGSRWMPLIPDKDVKALLDAMNGDLAAAARETGTLYLDAPLRQSWSDSDFVDTGHFSPAGAMKLASAIAPGVADACRP
jgi:lysophospholipase L1-like esterase